MSDPYVWYEDMRMLDAGTRLLSLGADSESDRVDTTETGFKPRQEEPAWVLPVAVVIMLLVIAVAATVIGVAVATN